ncbi:MAG: cation-translocating P-type ATPase [Eubacteriales bacterium]|nr:cation-translocating P-type ATPase [Eubacteriales bacterium]MDD4541979.1 cation-translocating P-type ATPase [Eubacteriales bacterium]
MFKLSKKQIVWITGILALIALILNKVVYRDLEAYATVSIGIMILGTIIAGYNIFKTAFVGLRYGVIGIDLLVSIAAIGAVIIGEYWEAQAVTFLFTFGDYLESLTLEKTRDSIRSLMDLAPDIARIRRNGEELEISPDEVIYGDLVIIKPGEKIAVDGDVIEGSAYVNQAAITGESMPVSRDPGEEVFSGTIVESGYLVVKAEKVGEDTTFARILHMVEEAQDKKASSQKFLEKFAAWYTPAIILLSIVVGLISRDIRLALTLLVVSCPGALVISTPISYVAAIGNGAKNGVLVKGGEIMEKLGRVKAIAFDKTGTLTEGKPGVSRVKTFDMDENEFLRIAAIGESYSEHPLGSAIIREAEERVGKITETPAEAHMLIGHGLAFTYEGIEYFIGNRKLLDDQNIDYSSHEEYLNAEEELGQTAVIMASEDKVNGIISIADTIRPEANQLVADLHAQNVKHIVMLTGDNRRAAQAVADELGLDGHYSELLPEDKVSALTELSAEYGEVAMVGDGINDAPALASADLGIAIGAAGADVAMETADVVLMSNDIGRLSYAMGLSRATANNVKQNVIFAIIVVLVLLLGVLVQSVNMSLGMLVHEGSVLLVILNAMRLLNYGRKDKRQKPEAVKVG